VYSTIEIKINTLPENLEESMIEQLKVGLDIILLSGELEPGLERSAYDYIAGEKQYDQLLLILTTPGGSADTAYAIARKLNRLYDKFSILVNGYCKSAGTLLALGANELIVTNDAEFGPLDVQLFSPDEFLKRSSGMTITQAMKWVNEQAFEAFEQIFLNLRSRSGGVITTKTSGDIASNLVGTLYGAITDKLDPVTIGEMQRAVDIAVEYGKRLGVPSAIVSHLVKNYPSHGFIIDYEEARHLFPNCRVVEAGEYAMLCEICSILAQEFNADYTIEPHHEGILVTIKFNREVVEQHEGKSKTKNTKSKAGVQLKNDKMEQSKDAQESS